MACGTSCQGMPKLCSHFMSSPSQKQGTWHYFLTKDSQRGDVGWLPRAPMWLYCICIGSLCVGLLWQSHDGPWHPYVLQWAVHDPSQPHHPSLLLCPSKCKPILAVFFTCMAATAQLPSALWPIHPGEQPMSSWGTCHLCKSSLYFT